MKKVTAGNLEMTREVTRKNNCPAIILCGYRSCQIHHSRSSTRKAELHFEARLLFARSSALVFRLVYLDRICGIDRDDFLSEHHIFLHSDFHRVTEGVELCVREYLLDSHKAD